MAGQPDDPVVQRRRLRTDLRALRRQTGQTQEQVAQAMDWSTSKILRIENGDVRVTPSDVRVLATHYGVTEKKRIDQLVEMARSARRDSWPDFKDVHQQASLNFFGFEAAASLIRDFSVTLVPGLLQTEEYGREVLANAYGYSEEQVNRRWEARSRRQELHERPTPPEMFYLFDEGVVRRVVGSPRVMRRQLEHLVSVSDHISIRVVPFSTGAYPGMIGPFILLEFPNAQDDDVLFLEHVDGDKVIRDDPAVTTQYTERFFDLEKIALSEDETRQLLNDIIAERRGGAKVAAPTAEAKV